MLISMFVIHIFNVNENMYLCECKINLKELSLFTFVRTSLLKK